MAVDRRQEGNTTLRKTQLTQVYMLEVLDEICSRHNILYFLMAGTLLGALRHDGFIPWDDDIDVGMLKRDYIEFKRIVANELPEGLFFQDEKDMHNNCPCGKLRDLNSFFFNGMGSAEKYDRMHYGIPLDIFPYVRTPRLPGKWVNLLAVFRHGAYQRWHDLMNRQRRSIFLKLFDLVLAVFWKTLHGVGISVWNALAYIFPSSIWHMPPESAFFWSIDENELFPLGKHIYEGKLYSIPKNSEKYLTLCYGDWRKVPPVDKRPVHSQYVFPDLTK